MARESKYSLEVPQIPEDEPIILFRAQDITVPTLLEVAAVVAEASGSPKVYAEHMRAIRTNVIAWQTRNRDKVKAPD